VAGVPGPMKAPGSLPAAMIDGGDSRICCRFRYLLSLTFGFHRLIIRHAFSKNSTPSVADAHRTSFQTPGAYSSYLFILSSPCLIILIPQAIVVGPICTGQISID
jgi:hypothetical protein